MKKGYPLLSFCKKVMHITSRYMYYAIMGGHGAVAWADFQREFTEKFFLLCLLERQDE